MYGDKDKYKAKIKSFEKIMKDGIALTDDQRVDYEKNIALYNKNYLTKEEQESYKAAISEYNKLQPKGEQLVKLSDQIKDSFAIAVKNKKTW